MTLGTKLLIVVLGLLAFTLVTAVLRVLANWSQSAVSRHDLIVESRARRAAYFQAVAERHGFVNDSMEVLDD